MWPRADQNDLAARGLATRGPTYTNGPAAAIFKLSYLQLDYRSWHMLTLLTAIRVILSDTGYEFPLVPSTKAKLTLYLSTYFATLFTAFWTGDVRCGKKKQECSRGS